MNAKTVLFIMSASVLMGTACSPLMAATLNAPICNPPAHRADWIAFISRELHTYDPDHAAQMTEAVSEIIQGQMAPLMARIHAGLDPNKLLILGSIPALNMSLLTLAAAACQDDVARQLVAAGALVNAANPPLAVAAAKGDVPLATFLIEEGADINKTDLDGDTPLENAAALSQLEMVKLLLEKGADPVTAGKFLEHVSASSTSTSRAIAGQLRASMRAKH